MIGRVGRQLSSRLWRASVEEEVDAELAFHLEMTTRDLVAGGMTPEAARAEALRRFGDAAAVEAQCRRFGRERDRQRSRAEYFGELRQDAAFAIRQLGRARSFAAVAVGTLALGIGATAAVFGALHAVVLRPLPFADPERVVVVQPTQRGVLAGAASNAEFSAMREQTRAFEAVAAVVAQAGFTLAGVGGDATPEVIGGSIASGDFFRVFGVTPALGRGFVETDDQPGAPRVVVLSDRLWRRKLGGDRAVLGTTLQLNGQPHEVIGVMPPSFDLTGQSDELWTPFRLSREELDNPSGRYLQIVARLRPGVTRAQASAAADAAERGLAARKPQMGKVVGAYVVGYAEKLVGDSAGRLLVLLGAVGFVLLIACVNVANLLLARGTVRAKELAVRAAVGAGRGRLVRQLLAESLVLALLGALLGVGLAHFLVRGLVAIAPQGVPRLEQARVDGAVLAFTLGVAVLCSLLVGLLPALRSAGAALQAALQTRGALINHGPTGGMIRQLLVAAEVALAMTLLTGAGLLIRTAWHVRQVDPGFEPSHVLSARLILPAGRYADAPAIVRAYREINDAVAAVPGVRSASLAVAVPLSGSSVHSSFVVEGQPTAPGERPTAALNIVSPGYFATLGIPFLDGRDVLPTDDASSPDVVVVSQSLARRHWPGERAVGKRINLFGSPETPRWVEVVGVVGDLHGASLTETAEPTLYIPFAQLEIRMWGAMQRSLVIVARTAPEPATLVPAIRRAVMTVDPSLPLADQNTLEELLAGSLATARFNTQLLTTLGLIALLLASVGVYGVVAYFVSQRTQEIGLRMALGATPAQVWRLVVRRGLAPIVWGVGAGALMSLATARLLQGQLYGVESKDPVTLVGVALLLLLVSVLATYVPARRAMRVAPAVALGTG